MNHKAFWDMDDDNAERKKGRWRLRGRCWKWNVFKENDLCGFGLSPGWKSLNQILGNRIFNLFQASESLPQLQDNVILLHSRVR